MRNAMRGLAVVLALMLAVGSNAALQRVTVPQGTQVFLAFDQALRSSTIKVGMPVRLHVRDNVMVNRHLVLARGTKVTGVITSIEKRKSYGVDANMRIALNPVKSESGSTITLMPRNTNKFIGKNSGKAAGATAGGAMILGPVGLAGGYFVHGKKINIKVGDLLDTEVTKTTMIRR
jgi:hypothetical protein